MKGFSPARRALAICAASVAVVGGVVIGAGLVDASPTVTEVASVESEGYLALGANGDVVIPNYEDGDVYQVTPNGTVTVVATFPGNDSGGPWATTGDAEGNVYVSLYYTGVIEKITPSGTVSEYASSSDLQYAYGMAFGPSGLLYVQKDGDIYSVSSSGTVTFVTSGASSYGLAIDGAGNFYTASGESEVYETTPGGVTTTLATVPGAEFTDVAVGPSGDVYAADVESGNIYRITPAGAVTTAVTYAELGGEYVPFSLDFDASGTLYAADSSGPIWRITGVNTPPTPQGLSVTETSGQVTATWTGGPGLSYTCTLMYGFGDPSSFEVTVSSPTCTFAPVDTTVAYGVQVVANNGSASSAPALAFGSPAPVVTPPAPPKSSKRTIVCQKNHGSALKVVTRVHPTCPRGWHRVA